MGNPGYEATNGSNKIKCASSLLRVSGFEFYTVTNSNFSDDWAAKTASSEPTYVQKP